MIELATVILATAATSGLITHRLTRRRTLRMTEHMLIDTYVSFHNSLADELTKLGWSEEARETLIETVIGNTQRKTLGLAFKHQGGTQ